jgi:hypothetical protein
MPNTVSLTFEIDKDSQGRTTLRQVNAEIERIGATAKRTSTYLDSLSSNDRALLRKYENAAKGIQQAEQAAKKFHDTEKESASGLEGAVSLFKSAVVVEFFRRGASEAIAFGKSAVQAFNEAQSAALGLQSVATFKGFSGSDALESVRNLAVVKDGLLSLADASQTVKNFLKTGFSLDQAISLTERFADAAAFGKSASLSFGDAVRSASEGVATQSSQLLNNVSIVTNLSTILERAGLTLDDLTSKTKGAAAVQALYNGLMNETADAAGNSAKITNTFAGAQARLDAVEGKLLVTIGEVISKNPELNAGFTDLTGTIVTLTKEIGTPGSGANKALNDMVTLSGYAVSGISNIIAVGQKLAPAFSVIKEIATLGGTFDIFGFSRLEQAQAKAKKLEDVEKLINRIQIGLNDTPAKLAERVDRNSTEGARKQLAELEAGIQASIEADKKPKEEFDKKFAESMAKASDALEKLKIETESDPFNKLALSAQESSRQIQKEFSGLPVSIRKELERLNDIKFGRDLFKENLAHTDRLNSLLDEQAKIGAGLGGLNRAQETGQRRQAFVTGQFDLEQDQRTARGQFFSEADTLRRKVGELQSSLSGKFAAEAIEQATRGVNRDVLDAAGVRNARIGALDTLSSEQRKDFIRQQSISQLEDEARVRQIKSDQAALAQAGDDPLKQSLALDRLLSHTSDIGKLTEDQSNLRADALKRRIEIENAADKKKEEKEEKREKAQENFTEALIAFTKGIKDGLGIDVTVSDAETTKTDLGVAPGSDTLLGKKSWADLGNGFLGGTGIKF